MRVALVAVLDPGSIELIQDFRHDRSRLRVLEIDCEFTDDYLVGHARRVGLAGAETPVAAMQKLLPTIRYDVKFESDRLRELERLLTADGKKPVAVELVG